MPDPSEDVNDIIDKFIVGALKLVTKGVIFLDVLEEVRRQREPAEVIADTALEDDQMKQQVVQHDRSDRLDFGNKKPLAPNDGVGKMVADRLADLETELGTGEGSEAGISRVKTHSAQHQLRIDEASTSGHLAASRVELRRGDNLESSLPIYGESPGSCGGGAETLPAVEHDQQGKYTDGNSWYNMTSYNQDGGTGSHFAFEAALMSSRVYSSAAGKPLDASSRGSSERSARWSAFSRLSLGDISTYNIVNAPVPQGGQLPFGEDAELDLGLPGINDARAFTVADSGYGTASKTTATAALHLPAQQDTDFDDVTSVITDNMSLDLPEGVSNTYVREIVERIIDAMSELSVQETQREQLIRMLPDLLRVFALRVSFAEETAEGHAVGLFTRKYRE
jgi:hypothetical protein